MKNINELVENIRESGEWIEEDIRELCDAAGMLNEFEAADADDFEAVVFKAANALGVDIL